MHSQSTEREGPYTHTSEIWSYFSTVFVNNKKQDFILFSIVVIIIFIVILNHEKRINCRKKLEIWIVCVEENLDAISLDI